MRALFEQIADASRWLWARRHEAIAGGVVFVLTVAVSALRPGHLWAH